jgi:ribokinase
MKKIAVIGSINTDLVVRSATIPRAGQTLMGHSFMTTGGGKGANQAVAAARLGGRVTLVGKVGNDSFGQTAIENFRKEGMDVSHVYRDELTPSGIAVIVVDDLGENIIVVAPGANAGLSINDLLNAEPQIEEADIVLFQLEIPMATVAAGISIAKKYARTVILNPAPAATIPDEILQSVDVIVPNQTEAELLTGVSVIDMATAGTASEYLHAKGIPVVILTMGEQGAYLSSAIFKGMVPGFETGMVIDTVAAGDTFCGGLAIALAKGKPLKQAVEFANAAAGIAVTRAGAQSSIPFEMEVERLLQSRI